MCAMTKQRLQKGFTLIELMVVIIIIGILVAVALPHFMASQDRAKMAAVKSNGKVLQTIIETINIDQGVYPNNIQTIESSPAYKVFANPFSGAEGTADLNGRGAWRTNDDGSLDYADNGLLTYPDAGRSSGLVFYVGLNGSNAATTRFNGVTGSKSSDTSMNYLIFGCDKEGLPIPRFALTAGELTPAGKRLLQGS